MSHTTCRNSQDNTRAVFHCSVKGINEESVNDHKQPVEATNNSQVINKRKKNYSERNHNLWLRRVRRLLFPEREQYRESLLYQVPLWEDEGEDQLQSREKESFHEELLQLLRQIQHKKVEVFKARWNFDPLTQTPLEGRWKWTELPE
ncbi:hypothetical protein Gasu2_48010 [Galdieria sulphuraria]|uniref:Cyclin-dependent kinase inhibitor domain-containing protein n=1 Tax=Galdieria sulphuraria TaxID=130081 RepID=M2XTE5_GALSU|nr:uncharacterized protein Gasu_54850 [Galdieria sulphuraria]EME26913.1 hypothetical protein Gasu_54850 [Galdieria sulphuraria]GJD10621.1 hypothetical protein Gasu2_48010 [Galdieria sulphuraria]|eukprot:XP_005703433.1 hypothetical protein Gasu_54850 [Galdieria sulphuraria]